MKKALVVLCMMPLSVFAGGGSGGTPPSLQLDILALMSQSHKADTAEDECRRVHARLSVSGTETAWIIIEGKAVQQQKICDGIVGEPPKPQ